MQLSEMDDFLADHNIKIMFDNELFLLVRTIATCMNCGIAVGSNTTETPFVFWNAKATEILGRGPTDKPPVDWIDIYGLRDVNGNKLAADEIPLNKAMNGIPVMNQVIIIRNCVLNKDFFITCNAMPIIKNDIIIGGVVVFVDVSHLHQQVFKIENINNKIKSLLA